MTDVREELMASIRAGLAGMHDQSVRHALEFYEEYIAESLEAGRSREETLSRLGGVPEIVAHIRAEAALARAESRPGFLRMIRASRQVLRGIADSAARVSLIAGVSIPWTLSLGLSLLAGAALLAALGSAALAFYGVTTMPAVFLREKIGVAGAAVFSAALLVGIASTLQLAARAVNRVTLRVLRKGLRRDSLRPRKTESRELRSGRTRTILLGCGVACLLGIAAMIVSGLPVKLFSIWNSQKPQSLAVRTWRYPRQQVRNIAVETLNTAVVLETAAMDDAGIRVTYEEPQWLTGTSTLSAGKLAFTETSSGFVPFMDFIAFHPGTTSLRIEVPRGYIARSVTLTSRSGSVSLSFPARSIRASTYSGSIRFITGGTQYRIRASAPGGMILVQGSQQHGGLYEGGYGGNTAELSTVKGLVEIGEKEAGR